MAQPVETDRRIDFGRADAFTGNLPLELVCAEKYPTATLEMQISQSVADPHRCGVPGSSPRLRLLLEASLIPLGKFSPS